MQIYSNFPYWWLPCLEVKATFSTSKTNDQKSCAIHNTLQYYTIISYTKRLDIFMQAVFAKLLSEITGDMLECKDSPLQSYHPRLLAHDGTVHMMSYTTRSINGSFKVRGKGRRWEVGYGIWDRQIFWVSNIAWTDWRGCTLKSSICSWSRTVFARCRLKHIQRLRSPWLFQGMSKKRW